MITRTPLGRGLAVLLCLGLSQLGAPVTAAAEHVVGKDLVSTRLAARAAERAAQVQLVDQALSTPEAAQQAKSMGADVGRLRAAVPHLSDSELADLSQRAANVKDVAAGHGSNDALAIVGLVLLIAGLVVLVAVGDDYDDYYYDDCYCY